MANNIKKEFSPDTKITVRNLYPWPVSFQVFNVYTNKLEDVIIEGSQVYKRLSFQQIEDEIFKDNIAFVGVNGSGNHAMLRVEDDDAFKALFDVDKRSFQLSDEAFY